MCTNVINSLLQPWLQNVFLYCAVLSTSVTSCRIMESVGVQVMCTPECLFWTCLCRIVLRCVKAWEKQRWLCLIVTHDCWKIFISYLIKGASGRGWVSLRHFRLRNHSAAGEKWRCAKFFYAQRRKPSQSGRDAQYEQNWRVLQNKLFHRGISQYRDCMQRYKIVCNQAHILGGNFAV